MTADLYYYHSTMRMLAYAANASPAIIAAIA
jgi:hypothetical protein